MDWILPPHTSNRGLFSYINRRAYLKALIPGGSRFDMTGQPNGEVTPEQQQDAQRKLDKWGSAKTGQPVNEVSR
ncbi:TPA: ProQ/FINO family protein [Morganella morganii]